METILVTDSLFVAADHEHQLADAGFRVERLDKPAASEDELCAAVAGKAGYILGGVEHVTDAVIEAGADLRAVVFTGADWRHYIPGHRRAVERGVALANCPGANAPAVAEYAVTLLLGMTRNVFGFGPGGGTTFATTPSLTELRIGIVGLGAIGTLVARHLHALGACDLAYAGRTRKPALEEELGLTWSELPDLMPSCDVVSLHASKEAGSGYVGRELLGSMRPGALLVDTSFTDAVDRDALYEAVSSGAVRAALDQAVDARFDGLPAERFYASPHTAFNTRSANRVASDMATRSLINLLTTGEDEHRVA